MPSSRSKVIKNGERDYNPLLRRNDKSPQPQSSSSSSSSSEEEDSDDFNDDSDSAENDKEILENNRRMRFNDVQRKRDLIAKIEQERNTLQSIQRERNMRQRLDEEMIEMKKKLSLENTLNEEEDIERMRNAENAAESLCKSLDADDSFYSKTDIDWDEHEQKWIEFNQKNNNKIKDNKKISMHDIPWPPTSAVENDLLKHMAAYELRSASDDDVNKLSKEAADDENSTRLDRAEKIYKRAFRRANLRCHPDKLTAKFGNQLDECDKKAILVRVEEISMIINSAYVEFKFF